MTQEQFIEALIEMGYKLHETNALFVVYSKRNKQISLGYQAVLYVKQTKHTYYELSQFDVTDYKKALSNIKKFERKIGV